MPTPLINGQAYDYAQIRITLAGVPLFGVNSLSYSEEQDKTNNFGAGDRPVSRGKAAINANGSIDLSMNEVENLRAQAPNGSLVQLPSFEIVVAFLNEQQFVSHILKNVEFLNDGVDTSQGDNDITRGFDLIISHIVYGP